MRTRWPLLVGAGFFLPAGCSLIANLNQFDGAREVATDAGAEAAADQDADAMPPLLDVVADEASSFDSTGADASDDAGEGDAADSADTMDASPDSCGVTSPNLLANPGFECGEPPWFSLAGNPPLEIVTSPVHGGASACLVRLRTQSYDGPAQDVLGGLTSGILYKGSAWVQIGMIDGGAASEPASMTATFTCAETSDAGNTYVQVATGTVSSGVWTQIMGTLVIPSGCTPVNPGVYVEGPPPGVDLYVDDLYLSE